MKKLLFAIISCAVAAAMLASCGEKTTDDTKIENELDEVEVTDTSSVEETEESDENKTTELEDEAEKEAEPEEVTEEVTEEPTEEEPVQERPDIYMTTGEFKALLGERLDEMKPSESIGVSESNVNNLLYLVNADADYNTDVDLTVTFGNGETVTLPASFDSIKNTGWTLASDDSEKISNEYYTEVLYKNADGENISLWTTNLDDSSEGAEVELSACDFYEIKLEKNFIGAYGPEQNSLKFTFGGGLNESSTLFDFLEKMGTPGRIDFQCTSKSGAMAFLTYFNEKGDGITVAFQNYTGDFVIKEISFKYNYANLM